MDKITRLGRDFFALAALASGLQQLVTADFVRLVPGTPAWLPWPAVWAWGTGAVLGLAGAGILSGRWARPGAIVLAALLLGLFLILYLPPALANPFTGFMWTNPSKTLALFGGAALIAGLPSAGATGTPGAVARSRPLGWIFLSGFFLICGAQHFVYAGFVDTLVPKWIPPGPRFWTLFAGVALLAGGLGLDWGKTRRPAALLSALMVFLWVLLLHIPRTVAMKSTFELDGVFEALAISGVALLVAGSRPRGDRPVQDPQAP